MVLENIQYPSPCGPAAQVDTTVRSAFVASCDHLLTTFVDIGVGFPAHPGPHCAQCSVTSGIMLAWNFEAADSEQAWLLSQTTAGHEHVEHGVGFGPQCEVCLSIFDLWWAFCRVSVSAAIEVLLRKFTFHIALRMSHLGYC